MRKVVTFGSILGSLGFYTTFPYLEKRSLYSGAFSFRPSPLENPEGYKDPGERNIPFANITLDTED